MLRPEDTVPAGLPIGRLAGFHMISKAEWVPAFHKTPNPREVGRTLCLSGEGSCSNRTSWTKTYESHPRPELVHPQHPVLWECASHRTGVASGDIMMAN